MPLSQNAKKILSNSALGCAAGAAGAAIGGAAGAGFGCCIGGNITQGIVGSQAVQWAAGGAGVGAGLSALYTVAWLCDSQPCTSKMQIHPSGNAVVTTQPSPPSGNVAVISQPSSQFSSPPSGVINVTVNVNHSPSQGDGTNTIGRP